MLELTRVLIAGKWPTGHLPVHVLEYFWPNPARLAAGLQIVHDIDSLFDVFRDNDALTLAELDALHAER